MSCIGILYYKCILYSIQYPIIGGFGEGTHELIKEATNDTEWSPNDPWVKPSPKSHAYLTFGFALARANARMLLHADSRRRSAKNRVARTHHTPAVCDFVDCSWVTLVYSCLVLVSCTTNVFCILYFATLTVTEHTGHNLGTVPQNYTNAELAAHAM